MTKPHKSIPEIIPHEERDRDFLFNFVQAFRETFSNSTRSSYGQCYFYPSDGHPISAQEAFNTEGFVVAEKIDNELFWPVNPDTGEQAIPWHHQKKTLENWQRKMSLVSSLAVLRNDVTKKISGAMYCGVSTLKEAFEIHEEWQNPHQYSIQEKPDEYRNFESFLETLKSTFPCMALTAETKFAIWNCNFVTAEAKKGDFLKMARLFFSSPFPKEMLDLPTIGELIHGSNAFSVFGKIAEFIDTGYTLTDSHHTIIVKDSWQMIIDNFNRKFNKTKNK